MFQFHLEQPLHTWYAIQSTIVTHSFSYQSIPLFPIIVASVSSESKRIVYSCMSDCTNTVFSNSKHLNQVSMINHVFILNVMVL